MKLQSLKCAVLAVMGALCLGTLSFAACPPSPAPGSTVKGLKVDGLCVLISVMAKGGVTVVNDGHLQMETTTVDGGINVEPGGELDVNATTLGGGVPTGTTSTINGSINITQSYDVDIETAQVNGGITINGSGAYPTICGNSVAGSSSFTGMTGNIGGGPFLVSPNLNCSGNSFNGSLTLTNSYIVMGGNTINGDLLCSNTTVIVTSPNTITGKNTCY